MKFLNKPLETLTISYFYWMAASIDTRRSPIDTDHSPITSVRF
jgi:hypothetical protein